MDLSLEIIVFSYQPERDRNLTLRFTFSNFPKPTKDNLNLLDPQKAAQNYADAVLKQVRKNQKAFTVNLDLMAKIFRLH